MKRYTFDTEESLSGGQILPCVRESEHGEFVLYDDCELLRSDMESLKRENERLQKLIASFGFTPKLIL